MADGDQGWLGVNMRLEPTQLQPGFLCSAINARFNRGRIETRLGMLKLSWSNRIGTLPGNPTWEDYDPIPYDVVFGAGVFSDPDDAEWIVVAGYNSVYVTREGNMSRSVPLPAGTVIDRPVIFEQCMGELIMFRGPDMPELRMRNVEEGFTSVTQQDNTINTPESENPWDGTLVIPPASTGLYLQNRLFVPYERDLLAVSDYLNYTRYQPIRASFRINQGSPDRLVALAKFNETTVLAFKEASVYRIMNVYGDLSAARLDEVTRQYGCRAPKSIVQVGTDVWFLADRRGVSSITQTEQDKLQAVDVPVSEPIQPIIDQINWQAAARACAAYFDNKFYLAVPIGNSDVVQPDMIPVDAVFDVKGEYAKYVTPGKTYHYDPGLIAGGASGEALLNGTERLYSATDFIAQGQSVIVFKYARLFLDDFESEGDQIHLDHQPSKWDVLYNIVDLLSADWAGWEGFQDGVGREQGFYLDLGGAGLPNDDGAVIQTKETFTLIGGKSYRVRFKLAGSHRTFATNTTVSIMVGPNFETPIVFLAVLRNALDEFEEFSLDYTPANDTNVKINIACSSPGGSMAGALLDDVFFISGIETVLTGPVASSLQEVIRAPNNAVLVYDFLSKAWAGYDMGTSDHPLNILEWFHHTYNGVRRLFCLTADGFINLYEEGLDDELSEYDDATRTHKRVSQPIELHAVTRGYNLGNNDRKRWKGLELQLSSWSPIYDLGAIIEGDTFLELISQRARSRTTYFRPFNQPAYDPTNSNDDHGQADREDYSVLLTDEATEVDPGASGIEVNRHARYAETARCARTARYVQFVINNQGRLLIHGLSVTASPGPRTGGESL